MGKVYDSLKDLNDDLKKQEQLINNVDRYTEFVDKFPEKISRMNRMIDRYDSMLDDLKEKKNELLVEYEQVELCKKALKEFKKLGIDANSIKEKVAEFQPQVKELRKQYNELQIEYADSKHFIDGFNKYINNYTELKNYVDNHKDLQKLIEKCSKELVIQKDGKGRTIIYKER